LRVVFFDATVWRYTITGVSKIIKEGVFKADETGLRFKAMDPSHVIMIDLFFPSESFEEYEIEEEEKLGINLEEFSKVLRRARKDDKLELKSLKDKIEVIFRGHFNRRFIEPLLQLEYQELPEPRIEFKVDARMIADQLREAVRDIELMGDNIIFLTKDDKLLIYNESEIGKAAVELDVESGALLSIESDGEQKASYGLEYIESLLPAVQKAEIVKLEYSTDMPCKLTFELPQGARLVTYIAPRTG
jgi:proliferating cell nuclear antigen